MLHTTPTYKGQKFQGGNTGYYAVPQTLFGHYGETLGMAERTSVHLEQHQLDVIEDMAEEGKADNESEALRMFLNAGMREYGYRNGESNQTVLRTVIHEMAKLFFVSGLVLLGVTYFLPVELRLVAVGPIFSGLFLLGVDRALESVEPRVSKKLRGFVPV